MIIKLFLIFFVFFFIDKNTNASTNCNQYTEKIGKEYKIPNKLLTSISLVESGLKKGENFVSWPWTLNVSGKSKFFKSKDETLIFLKKNYDKKKNIDVGCMQISLKYHGQNFKNFNQILDPKNNVEYAAKFLKSLYSKHKTWNEAISRYHSSIPKRKVKYLKKVHSYWSDLRQKKIKMDVVVELEEMSKRERKIKYFRNEFKNQKLLDSI
ncbi:MAG: hypothetical protein CL572_03945 [Alphaproteobacteria bacterium]|jgi:hypothetical protein|nr:hypothetical protein [Alphaproteobacteria bacterium]